MTTPIKQELARFLLEASERILRKAAPEDVEASFEIPKEEKFGDLSTNFALKAAKEAKRPPRPLAEEIRQKFEEYLKNSPLGRRVAKVSVEGPGFINFHYSNHELASVLAEIHEKGDRFGKPAVQAKNFLLEFVSANPTGPLTVAHGRQAALGDALARILRFCGHRVTTEYYNNDEGVQIETLGKSLQLRVEEIRKNIKVEIPENYYRGEYLIEIAKKFVEKHGAAKTSERPYADFAAEDILSGIKKDLADFGVAFDNYYSQQALGKSGKVEKTLGELKKKGVVYVNEGATWFRSIDFGDDKDRVLVKSDGSYTYLTPDIAYHDDKFGRGFDELINILGPDHHGYIARLKASQAALGHNPDRLRVLIAQLVTLYEGGKQVRMSTRAGEFVTLREILDEVGRDAGRFFFVMRKFDAHLDFDLELAKSQTPDNPVFYVQYAHARIESIKKLAEEKGARAGWDNPDDFSLLSGPHEIRLLRLLSQYSETVLGAERTLEPYRLVPYLTDLAAAFHRFYGENRVVTDEAPLTRARLALVWGVQSVIRSGLALLGVSAPVKM